MESKIILHSYILYKRESIYMGIFPLQIMERRVATLCFDCLSKMSPVVNSDCKQFYFKNNITFILMCSPMYPFAILTRMHSSRMRTAHSSSHPGGSPPGTPRADPPGPGTLLDQASPRQDQASPGPGTPQDQAPLPPWNQAPPM